MNFDGPGATQMGFSGSQFGTTQAGADGKRSAQSLRAVTFKQLLRDNAEVDNEQFKVDSVEVQTVTVIGKVVSVQESGTRTAITLDDSTGKFDITQWNNDADERKPDYRTGSYLRVYGNMTSRGGKLSINAFTVKEVHDFNEITYHFLQCIYQHLQVTKGAPPSIPTTTASPAPGLNASTTTTNVAAAPAGPVVINDEVMSVYNDPGYASLDQGISLEEVHKVLTKRGMPFSQQEIMKSVEFLTNEGLLYSTTDEQHYKSTHAC